MGDQKGSGRLAPFFPPTAIRLPVYPSRFCAMSMREKLDLLQQKRAESQLGGGAERIKVQHEKGKMTARERLDALLDRKSTRLNSSHGYISYAVFCLKKKKKTKTSSTRNSSHTTTRTASASASGDALRCAAGEVGAGVGSFRIITRCGQSPPQPPSAP